MSDDSSLSDATKFSAKMQAVFLLGNLGIFSTLSRYFAPWTGPEFEFFTGILAAGAVAFVYTVLPSIYTPSKPRNASLSIRALKWCCVACFLYGVVATVFLRANPEWEDRTVVGIFYHPKVQEFVNENPTISTSADLLKGSHGEPSAIWVDWSITVAKILLGATWSFASVTIVFLFAVFVKNEEYDLALKAKRKAKPKNESKV